MRIPWNKGKKMPQFSGQNHPNWVGDKVGYYGIHDWLQANFGRANKCENPSCFKKHSKFHWAKLKDKKYERRRENFWMLCVGCHNIYDKTGVPAHNKGQRMSIESRKKMSLARMGKTPWNKGRKETRPEVLKKQSNSHLKVR